MRPLTIFKLMVHKTRAGTSLSLMRFLVRLGQGIAASIVIAALTMGTLPKDADACLMPEGADDADYIALATQYQGKACWIRVDYNGITDYASAVRLNNEWVLTAAHVLYSDTNPTNDAITVGTGSNFFSSPGEVRSAYTDFILYPGFNDSTLNSFPDLALVKLKTPLSGTDVVLGTAAAGEVVYSVGYGRYGTPSTGLFVQDGNARAFEARVDRHAIAAVNDYYYNADTFGYYNAGLTLNGRGAGGDSGGPVFNSFGDLVGINKGVAGDPRVAESLGTTYYVDLSNPEISSWIQESTGVPEPFSLGLLAIGAAGLLRRRHQNKAQR